MRVKAVALISGGLDSALSARMIKDQGVEVVGLYMLHGFEARRGPGNARRVAEEVGIPLEVVDIREEFLRVVLFPEHGYGANANPCIDCKILMLRKAWERGSELGAKFIVTGEVVGQRPMTQRLPTMRMIEKKAGVEGLVLRPLSAKLLPPSIPEREGWVRREEMLAIRGRGRKAQLELARKLGITSFSTPAGGCLLTDENFARRVFDLLEHKPRGEITTDDFRLLRLGRHFRLSPKFKLIVARDRAESRELLERRHLGWLFVAVEAPGPIGLGLGEPSGEEVEVAARIVARYCDTRGRSRVKVRWEREGKEGEVEVEPADYHFVEGRRI